MKVKFFFFSSSDLISRNDLSFVTTPSSPFHSLLSSQLRVLIHLFSFQLQYPINLLSSVTRFRHPLFSNHYFTATPSSCFPFSYPPYPHVQLISPSVLFSCNLNPLTRQTFFLIRSSPVQQQILFSVSLSLPVFPPPDPSPPYPPPPSQPASL